jgi:hypothetical protein
LAFEAASPVTIDTVADRAAVAIAAVGIPGVVPVFVVDPSAAARTGRKVVAQMVV